MSLNVRVVAPVGRDAGLIVTLLQQEGIASEACADAIGLLSRHDPEPIGPLLFTEEALTPEITRALAEFVHHQPPWSDQPVLILTSGGRETIHSRHMEAARASLGSPILLERPIRPETLLSSVRAAIRARRRQYEVRDALLERDHVLAELRTERETLKVMLDNLPVGVLQADVSGAVTHANAALTRVLGHPPLPTKEVNDHGHWVAFHPDGRRVEAGEYPLVRALRTGKVVPAEPFLYQRGDGRLAWVSISAAPIFDDAGNVLYGVAAIDDIDEQRRSSDILRTSEERFRRLVESASVGILIGDLEGGLSYMNPALLNRLGYTVEDISSGALRWDDLTPSEFSAADRNALEQLQHRGVAEPYQRSYRARDGQLIPVLFGAVRIPGPEGKASNTQIAAFLTDLTTQKLAEAALIQAEKLAAVGRLAASISHEINNPLEAVTNLLYLLRLETSLTDSAQTYLSLAESELARVSQIAAQTLRFHRQSTRPRAVTPEELLESVVALYQGRLQNSHIQLSFQHRGAHAFTCYEGDIRQVLNNLVANAIDSMRTGGRLVLRTRSSTSWRDGVAGIRIIIADTGHGMDRDTAKRVFEAFYTTKGINGTGLGLWISRGIIDKHHGHLDVRSSNRPGCSGTVFSLFLPQQSEAIEPSTPMIE